MFRLPVCPHCRTVYRYGDVVKNKHHKKIQCYNCKKYFRQSKKGYLMLGLLVFLVSLIINIVTIAIFKDIFKSVVPMFIISVVIIFIGLLLTPLFIKYKNIKSENN